jgi:single-stranded DNA-binding protein
MELNLIVLAGQLATEPEVRTFESGSNLLRLLVTVRSTEPRRRIDVIPVVMWDPPEDLLSVDVGAGEGVWVAGSVQRRFWSETDGRNSRIEVVAHEITFRKATDFEGVGHTERGEYPRPA